MNIFKWMFVSKNRNDVTALLKDKEITWELKSPMLAGLMFCIVLLFVISLLFVICAIIFTTLSFVAIIIFPILIILTILGMILTFFRKIRGMCFHKKSLLGLLDTASGREQWYCPICQKIYHIKKGEHK